MECYWHNKERGWLGVHLLFWVRPGFLWNGTPVKQIKLFTSTLKLDSVFPTRELENLGTLVR